MKTKKIIAIFTFLAVILFSITSFANNNMGSDVVNGARNIVGGAENVVEDAASGIAGGIRQGISGVENAGEDMTKGDNSAMQGSMTSNNNDRDYSATRTSATGNGTDNGSVFGMSPVTWTWIIMALVGIAIIALVWFYGKQNEVTTNNHDDNY